MNQIYCTEVSIRLVLPVFSHYLFISSQDHQYTYPVLYKHCWFTKSQLDLYENLSKDYKYPNDNRGNTKAEDGNKKSMTLTKIDDKFKLELINELKLKQFSNDQINTASQKANTGLINKIKNKVTYASKVRSKDEDKQSLVDVKVHQIVPSKPRAPPPPPPTVKIKTTPITSPTSDPSTEVDSSTLTRANVNKVKPSKVGKKKMPAPPPPAVHKPQPKEVVLPVVEVSPQEQEDPNAVDVTPTNDNTSEYSIATTTNLDSPTKSFCSIDDIPKTGFDFLDNW